MTRQERRRKERKKGQALGPWKHLKLAMVSDDDRRRLAEAGNLGYVCSFLNPFVQIQLYRTPWPPEAHPNRSPMLWLSCRREDREPFRDWRCLQRIKNEIAGTECEAMEIYPAESRRMDAANQTHLWVFPPNKMMPFGFMDRAVGGQGSDGSRQRPLTDMDRVEDLPEQGPGWDMWPTQTGEIIYAGDPVLLAPFRD